MKKIIFIIGPTGSGKSDLAVNLAKDLDCEIINADAFQVYKEISIGNNKINEKDKKDIKHHLMDLISINDAWSIKEFQTLFFELVLQTSKNFIVVGGSNLYIDCIIKNYNLNSAVNDLSLNLSDSEKWSLLHKLDENTAIKVGENNKRRINQNLKNVLWNKKKIIEIPNNKKMINPFIIKIEIDRNLLYTKINNRVDVMIENGWINEVNSIIQTCKQNSQIFQAIGYKEIRDHILYKEPLNIDKIKQRTRQYAKRQETWCKNKFNINCFFNDNHNYKEVLQKSKDFLKTSNN